VATPVLFLVRHAKAEGASPDGDAARRLTAEGRERFRRHLATLAGELPVRRIATSPFARAAETAALLAEATGARVEEEPRLASGALEGRQLLSLAAELGAGTALVGHNPEIAEAIHLASAHLAGGREADVPPGTVAALDARGRVVWIRPG
jgi:phosphohistidine phosphatase